MSRLEKPIETESRLVVVSDSEGGREVGVTVNGPGVSLWGEENIFKLIVMMVVQL
jgi:hypothetical protein